MDVVIKRAAWWQRWVRWGTTNVGAFGVTAVVALGSLAAIAPQCAPATAPSPAQQVVDLTNARRAESGLPPLTVDGRLTNAAQIHSADQAAANAMNHRGTDGSGPGERISGAGYRFSAWAENVGAGYPDAAAMVNGWMNSSGHRANILSRNVTQIGIGLAYSANGMPYWTMDLARPG